MVSGRTRDHNRTQQQKFEIHNTGIWYLTIIVLWHNTGIWYLAKTLVFCKILVSAQVTLVFKEYFFIFIFCTTSWNK